MLDENNTIFITDDSGNETAMEIVLTFKEEETGKTYVLFQEPDNEEGDVSAAEYDEDGNLTMVEDEETLNMCSEVLNAFDEEEGN